MDGGLKTRAFVTARVGVETSDREGAIRSSTGSLVRAGAVTQNYEDRCVAIVDEQGPYIVLAPGIALAHARPEDGANSLCVSAAVLAHPVAFGHPDNDPVDVVLAFASPDRQMHTGLLASLARALASGLADTLRRARSDAEATQILEEAIGDAG